MDFDWIIETPANEYNLGEELCFLVGCSFILGEYIRQTGDDITIKVTEVPNLGTLVGIEMIFNKSNLILRGNSFLKYEKLTFTFDEWDENDYVLIDNEEEELIDNENPTTIGYINKRIYKINHVSSQPRDGPLII